MSDATQYVPPPLPEKLQTADGRHSNVWAEWYTFVAERLRNLWVGTSTNDNAAVGDRGEYIEATRTLGDAVALSSLTEANVETLSLPAGDWEVRGEVWFDVGTGGALGLRCGISLGSATLPAGPGDGARHDVVATFTASFVNALPLEPVRISLAATTTVYLVALAGFVGGTVGAFGRIAARRVR